MERLQLTAGAHKRVSLAVRSACSAATCGRTGSAGWQRRAPSPALPNCPHLSPGCCGCLRVERGAQLGQCLRLLHPLTHRVRVAWRVQQHPRGAHARSQRHCHAPGTLHASPHHRRLAGVVREPGTLAHRRPHPLRVGWAGARIGAVYELDCTRPSVTRWPGRPATADAGATGRPLPSIDRGLDRPEPDLTSKRPRCFFQIFVFGASIVPIPSPRLVGLRRGLGAGKS